LVGFGLTSLILYFIQINSILFLIHLFVNLSVFTHFNLQNMYLGDRSQSGRKDTMIDLQHILS
jgi:hypothetical protein